MSLGGVLKSRIAASAIILSFFMPFFFISVISGCVEKNEAEVDSPVQVVRVKIKDVRDAAKEDVKPADEKTKQVDAIGPDVAVDDKRENKERVKRKGIYIVKKGESLYSIAKNDDVYGNPLKWISLFRLNLEAVRDAEGSGEIQHKILRQGMELRYVTAEAAQKAFSQIKGVWVVNVLSSQITGKIVPAATALIKEGYRVYIVEARVKGKDWLRLRIGFYPDSADAKKDSRKIMSIAGVKDAWVTKADEKEIREYGGF